MVGGYDHEVLVQLKKIAEELKDIKYELKRANDSKDRIEIEKRIKINTEDDGK